jgi:signal peptidase I
MASKRAVVITGFGGVLILILGFTLYLWVSFKTVVVSGNSMWPSFKNGERVLVSDAYWLVGAIKDGDVVVIRNDKKSDYIIKRVYKMSGEIVDFANKPYAWTLPQREYRVREGAVYVLGDNKAVSEDSRAFGPVDLSKIIGKVVVRPSKESK